jgi:hypothetical protein
MHGPKRVTAARKCLCLRSLDWIEGEKKGGKDSLIHLRGCTTLNGDEAIIHDTVRSTEYTVVIDRGAWKCSKVRRIVG